METVLDVIALVFSRIVRFAVPKLYSYSSEHDGEGFKFLVSEIPWKVQDILDSSVSELFTKNQLSNDAFFNEGNFFFAR